MNNNGLHDRIRTALRAAPGGLTSREIVAAVRGEYNGRDNAISCALRRMTSVTGDITQLVEQGSRHRYYIAGAEPTNLGILPLLTATWAHPAPLLTGDALDALVGAHTSEAEHAQQYGHHLGHAGGLERHVDAVE